MQGFEFGSKAAQSFLDARLEADTEFAHYALASTSERTELLKEWVAPDLLVLDDLFRARRICEHAAEVLQAIVHQRRKLRRPIVVTSNRVVQGWGKYLGDVTKYVGLAVAARLDWPAIAAMDEATLERRLLPAPRPSDIYSPADNAASNGGFMQGRS